MEDLHYRKEDLFSSIGRDKTEVEEIIGEVVKHYAALEEPEMAPETVAGGPRPAPADTARSLLEGRPVANEAVEAIIRLVGRPVIRVRSDALLTEDIPTETLKTELDRHTDTIETATGSVGRIELNGHPRLPWVGTGWIIDDDIIVTNRHVAREFAHFSGTAFDFLPGVFGDPMEASIDFLEEHGNTAKDEFELNEILYIEPDGGPDIALVRVNWASGSGPKVKLTLWEGEFDTGRRIAVVGYPARDTRTNIPQKMDEIFDHIYNVKRFAPGFVIGTSDQRGLLTHDCTTLGGNSGSTVIDVETGRAVALHFAGREQDANFAVLSSVVRSRLKMAKADIVFPGLGGIITNEVDEETPTVADLADRTGYNPGFLGQTVPLPGMKEENRANVAPVSGNNDGELKYTHYSVVMNSQRQVAFYAVVNIDGNQLHGIPRGSDKWYFDPRLSRDHQVGNELYRSNPLDRGHLVRRLDPSWGRSRGVAETAIEDSFFYTNCAPQHLRLNRHLWLGLEDHILNNTGAFDLKVTVFSGPVFRDDDQEYRGIKIPNEFWKVVAMIKPDDEQGTGKLSVTGYVLSQRSLIEDLEFVFGEHQGFQVRLDVIEALTGLDFGDLKTADPLTQISDEEALEAGASARGRRLFALRHVVI